MILVVNKLKRNAERLAEAFNLMGFLSYGVASSRAITEINPRYRAVILLSDSSMGSSAFESIIGCASSPALKIPIFSIGENSDPRIAEVLSDKASLSLIIKRIIRYQVINEKPVIGKYKCAGFDASQELSRILYFDRDVRLTKTEKMILRFLTRSYPLPVSAVEIIRYAIRPSRSPEPSSIRTHISMMNKKFKTAIGRPMIEFCDREGYILITPERKKGILR